MAFVEQTTLYDYNPTIWRVTSTENLDFTPGYLAQLTAKTLLGQVTQIRPAPMPKAQSGFIEHSQYDDFYFRIHVTPYTQSVGSLISNKTVHIKVWNAYFTSKTLNSITKTNVEGINIQSTEPYTYRPTEEVVYDITATIDGPPTINATYTFNFDVYSVSSSITGIRLVAFKWMPRGQFTEQLQFKTNVLKSWSGEQRIALRKAPRQVLQYNYIKEPSEIAELRTIAREWAHRQWGVPVWNESAEITNVSAGDTTIYFDTSYMSLEAGGNAFIWAHDNKTEAVAISAVNTNSIEIDPATGYDWDRALIMPIRAGVAQNGIQFTRQRGEHIPFNANFVIISDTDYSESNYPQYDGYDVMDDGNIIVGDILEQMRRPTQAIDNGQGQIILETTNNEIYNKKTIGKVTQGKEEHWYWKKWLHSVKGRQKAFWLPSFSKDLKILSPIYATETGVDIKETGIATYGKFPIVTRLKLKNGTIFYRKIQSATTTVNGENVIIDSSLGQDVTIDDIETWSFMNLVRLDADDIRMEYDGRNMTCNIPAKEVLN